MGIIIVVVLIGVALWYNGDSAPAQPEGDTVAVVNGEVITQARLDQRLALLAGQGQAVETDAQKLDILNQMVDQQLVLQDAAERGIVVTAEQADAQFEVVVGSFESPEAFQAALVQNSLSEADVRADVKTQLVLQQYAAELQAENNLTVTEEEVNALYVQLTEGQENVPSFEEVQAQLSSQIGQQKLNTVLESVLASLRATAEIEIFLGSEEVAADTSTDADVAADTEEGL